MFKGLHFRLGLWPFQYVNIPIGRHAVLVIGRGSISPEGRYRKWGISSYIMHLHHCCPERIGQTKRSTV